MVQGRALKAMQVMDARQATCSMNLSYLQALLANLFFSFRDFVLSCKKLLFWNDLGSRMVSDRPICLESRFIFPVIQTALMMEIWKVRICGRFDKKFPVSCFLAKRKTLRKMAPIFCFSLIHGEFSLTWWGKAPRSLESKSLYLCSTFQALFLQWKEITMISVFKNLIVSPIAASFLGFAVRSLPSPLRAFPLQTFLICNLVPLICNL